MVKFCEQCKKDKIPPLLPGYMNLIDSYTKDTCPQCKKKIRDVPITDDEFHVMVVVGPDITLLEEMIALKENDLTEFTTRMEALKIRAEQIEAEEAAREAEEEAQKYIVKCPYCGCTDIGVVNGEIRMFDGFGGSGEPQNMCKLCGYKWVPSL